MVKTPRTRHAKPRRSPVTIEHSADDAKALPADVTPAAPDVQDAPPVSASNEAILADEPAAAPETSPTDPLPGTEDGTAPAADQEYQPAASVQEPSGYGFRETADDSAGGDTVRDSSKSSSDTPLAPPPARRDGFGRVAAGVVGGLVALAVAGALQYGGVLGSPGQGSTDVEALRAELAALRDEAPAADAAALGQQVEALQTQLAGLEERMSAAPEAGEATQVLEQRLSDMERRVATLSEGAGGADEAAVNQLGERIAAAETAAKSAADAAGAAGGRIAALEGKVDELARGIEAQASQPRIALAIATAALKAAMDRGAPFLAELETFAAISPGAQVDALRPFAEKGVPTREDLIAEVESASAAMLAAARPVDPQAGFFDRLLHSAESLVSVRPIGSVEGEGAPERIARMEAALGSGELATAVAEFDGLPEAARAAGAGFGERLKARAEAETLVDRVIADAMRA
jgi:hypothetical protein